MDVSVWTCFMLRRCVGLLVPDTRRNEWDMSFLFAPPRGKRKFETGKGGLHEKSIDDPGGTGAADLRGQRCPCRDLSALFEGSELVRVVSEMPDGLLQLVLLRIGSADQETHLFLLHADLPELRIFQMQKTQVSG